MLAEIRQRASNILEQIPYLREGRILPGRDIFRIGQPEPHSGSIYLPKNVGSVVQITALDDDAIKLLGEDWGPFSDCVSYLEFGVDPRKYGFDRSPRLVVESENLPWYCRASTLRETYVVGGDVGVIQKWDREKKPFRPLERYEEKSVLDILEKIQNVIQHAKQCNGE